MADDPNTTDTGAARKRRANFPLAEAKLRGIEAAARLLAEDIDRDQAKAAFGILVDVRQALKALGFEPAAAA